MTKSRVDCTSAVARWHNFVDLSVTTTCINKYQYRNKHVLSIDKPLPFTDNVWLLFYCLSFVDLNRLTVEWRIKKSIFRIKKLKHWYPEKKSYMNIFQCGLDIYIYIFLGSRIVFFWSGNGGDRNALVRDQKAPKKKIRQK